MVETLREAFRRSGYVMVPETLNSEQLKAIDSSLDEAARYSTGLRQMLQYDWCRQLALIIQDQLISAGMINADYVCVQCTYFEKSVEHNWLVAPHQDLSIPVRSRLEHRELGGWSMKDGELFVQPPVKVIEELLAFRLHVDDCGVDDGALRLVPGSHRRGRISDSDKVRLREELGEALCPVAKGAAMAMSPLVLHTSSKSTGNSRRRVLHFLFGPSELPYGLTWACTEREEQAQRFFHQAIVDNDIGAHDKS